MNATRWTLRSLTKRHMIHGWLACLLISGSSVARHPNIVVILADDFGVGDIQEHYPDNKIATPYLDAFARQALRFTDAHSGSAVCSPTRYGLLTGRYSWRTRLQEWVIAAYEPPLIDHGRLTLPEFLRQHGYTTACIGKWHLGWEWPGPQRGRMVEERNGQKRLAWDFSQAIRSGPITRGFDYYFGVNLPNQPPFTFIENDRVLVEPSSIYRYDARQGDVMPRQHEGAPMAPGWRFDQILTTLTDRAIAYIEQQAERDEPFFLYFSMTSPHEPVSPSPQFAGKSGIAPIADFVMETDWSAGKVIEALDKAGLRDDTLVVFTADNGHSHYTGWERLVAAGHQPSGPYRGHKGDIWEGGHRVPLLLRWPGKVAPGQTAQLVCLNDLFATCAELLRQPIPNDAAEDSFSFLPVVEGRPSSALRDHIVHHSNMGEFAYRRDHWKLVFRMPERRLQDSRGKQTIAELYNLHDDVSEANNLADDQPQLVADLTRDLEQLIARGRSSAGTPVANDTDVRFDTIQTRRWADPISHESVR